MGNIFRNLDRVAGVAGGVFAGENDRQDQLLQDHLGRSQQRFIQSQRQTGLRQLQQARIDRDNSALNQKLQQSDQQFRKREKRLTQQHEDDAAFSRDQLAVTKAKNLTAQAKAQVGNVRDQLTAYDRGISNLIGEARSIASQADFRGELEPEQTAQLQGIYQRIRDKEMEKKFYAESNIPPLMQDKINKARNMFEQARLKASNKAIKSYKELVKMEAFYDVNKTAYEVTIETTKDAIYEMSKDPALRIDVENLSQSTNWSERLAEFRDAVMEYNTCIYKLRRYNKTWVLSGLFPNPREDLKLIRLKE